MPSVRSAVPAVAPSATAMMNPNSSIRVPTVAKAFGAPAGE